MPPRNVPRLRGKSGVYIDGLTQAKANLAALPEAFREVVADTFDVGSRTILLEAGRRVPVRSGALKASLSRNVREDGLQVAIGSSDWKAKFQEFGTNDTPEQKFLWPAFRLGARYVRKRIKTWSKEAGMKATARAKDKRPARAKA